MFISQPYVTFQSFPCRNFKRRFFFTQPLSSAAVVEPVRIIHHALCIITISTIFVNAFDCSSQISHEFAAFFLAFDVSYLLLVYVK